MGAVYRALDRRQSYAAVALKQMIGDVEPDRLEDLRQRFEREAQTLERLDHEAIPRVLDHFSDGPAHYLVMEFVEGRSLADLLKERGRLEAPEVLAYALQLCDLLEYLHEQPIIHRDVKPQNIIIGGDGRLVLVDFGIARGLETAGTKTLIGTLGYAPLEQVKGYPEPRSDLYAVGATMYHLLTGSPPNPFQIPPVEETNPAVDLRVAEVVNRATQETPARRFGSAAIMRRSLIRVLTELTPGARPAPRPRPAPSSVPLEPATMSGSLFATLLILFVILAGGLLYGLSNARPSAEPASPPAARATPPRPVSSTDSPPPALTHPSRQIELSPSPAAPALARLAESWFSNPAGWRCALTQGLASDGWLRAEEGEAAGVFYALGQAPPGPPRELSFSVLREGRPGGFLVQLGNVGVRCQHDPGQDVYLTTLIAQLGSQTSVSPPILSAASSFGLTQPFRLTIAEQGLTLQHDGHSVGLAGAQVEDYRQLRAVLLPERGAQSLQLRSLAVEF